MVFFTFETDARTHVPRSRHVESSYFRRLRPPPQAGVDNALSSAHCSSMLMRYLTNRTVAQGVDLLDIFSVPSKYFEGPRDIWQQHVVNAQDDLCTRETINILFTAISRGSAVGTPAG